MPELEIRRICPQCHGDGEILTYSGGAPGTGIPCTWPGCEGTGRIPYLKLSDDLADLLLDIKGKVDDIFEKVNE